MKNVSLLLIVISIFTIRAALVFCDDIEIELANRITTIDEYIDCYDFKAEIKYFEYANIGFGAYEPGNILKLDVDSLAGSLKPIPNQPENRSYAKIWFVNGKVQFIKNIPYDQYSTYSPIGEFYAVFEDTIEVFECREDGHFTSRSQVGVDLWVSIYKDRKLSKYLICRTNYLSTNGNGSNYKDFNIYSIATYDYYPRTDKVSVIKGFYNSIDMEKNIYANICLYDKDGNQTNSLYYYPEIKDFKGINRKFKTVNMRHILRGTVFTIYPHNLLDILEPAEKERKNNGCIITWERNDSLKYVSFGDILGSHKHFRIVLPDTIEEIYDPGYASIWYPNVYKTAAIFENDTLRTKIACLWESCDNAETGYCYKGKRIASYETFEYHPDSDTSAISYVYNSYNDLINGNWGYKKLWDRDGNLINRKVPNY